VRGPSPAGNCLLLTAGLAKTERGPILTIGLSLFSMSPSRAIVSGRSNFSSPNAAAEPWGGKCTHFPAPRLHDPFKRLNGATHFVAPASA